MLLKKNTVSFLIVSSLLLGSLPCTTEAKVVTEAERLQMLLQIKDLLNILVLLQVQVQEQNAKEDRRPYQSVYYNFPHKNIYFVVNGQLINSNGSKTIFATHKELFDLFTLIVGKSEVDKYVDEWRIFNNADSDLGAYVELMSATDAGPRNWVVGVNTAGYDSESLDSFVNLFIHEYGHIVLYDLKTFERSYKAKFWTVADEVNSRKIKSAQTDNEIVMAEKYFETNQNRFVNDYAVNSYEEDLAETFVYFVREDMPNNNTVRDQKIRTFYQEPSLVKIRTQIRENLKTTNL